jgi:hypothetical protein
MDIALILSFMRPNEIWTLSDNDYETLEWISKTKKPTLAEIEAAESLALADREKKIADANSKRNAILAKLGLTAEEAAVLLG